MKKQFKFGFAGWPELTPNLGWVEKSQPEPASSSGRAGPTRLKLNGLARNPTSNYLLLFLLQWLGNSHHQCSLSSLTWLLIILLARLNKITPPLCSNTTPSLLPPSASGSWNRNLPSLPLLKIPLTPLIKALVSPFPHQHPMTYTLHKCNWISSNLCHHSPI